MCRKKENFAIAKPGAWWHSSPRFRKRNHNKNTKGEGTPSYAVLTKMHIHRDFEKSAPVFEVRSCAESFSVSGAAAVHNCASELLLCNCLRLGHSIRNGYQSIVGHGNNPNQLSR